MPRYSSAYSDLIDRLVEINSIVSMAQNIERRGGTHRNITRVNALCRGGIVLLSSHLEGYIEDLGTLVVGRIGENAIAKSVLSESFRFYLSRDLINEITEASIGSNQHSKVLGLGG